MGWLARLGLMAAVAMIGSTALAQDAVKVGTTASASDAGIFIAADKGYFKKQDLDVTITPFTSGLTMFSAVATGQIDVGRSAQSAGLFNSFARGIEVALVADGGSLSKGGGYLAIALRKDLAGKVKGPADFKGRTVAVAGKGGTSDIILDRYLRSGGLTIKDIKRVPISIPDQMAAMHNGNIDAAVSLDPIMTAMVENGFAVRFKGGDEIYPNMQAALLIYSPAFAKKRDVAQRFMNAYVMAVRDYNDAFFHNKGRDEIIKILTHHTRIKKADVYVKMVPAGLNPDGALNIAGLKSDQQWYLDHELVKKKVDLGDFVDPSFAANAVKSLGPYRP